MKRSPETRNRILNVLYFVDANKTKSFKMSLRTVYAFVATLGILLVWSFVSTLLLYQEAQVADYRQERITDLLSTIFSYQQRYDAIYERSYPTAPKTVAGTLDKISKEAEAFGTAEPLQKALAGQQAIKAQKPVAKKEAPAKNDLRALNPTSPPASAQASAQASAEPGNANQKSAEPSNAKQKSAALAQLKKADAAPKVEQPFAAVLEAIAVTAKDQKSVDLGFSIRNNMKPKRAIGYVFARATFEQNGAKIVKTAPAGPNFSKVNKPIRARGYKFSIRSFTRKNITLNYPIGGDAKLVELELLMWSKTKREKVYPIEISKVRLVKELVKAQPVKAKPKADMLPTRDPFPAATPEADANAAEQKPQDAFPKDDPFQSPKLKGLEEEPAELPAPQQAAKDKGEAKELAKDISAGSQP